MGIVNLQTVVDAAINGPLETDIRNKILSIKSATIDRVLRATKTRIPGKSKCRTM